MSFVVVVDDRSTNRNILCRLATSLEAGTEAVSFDSPVAALAAMRFRCPDLIITDFNMPEMDGAQFVERCRRELEDSEVPIIVITAYEDRDFRYRALEAGATDFLLSPIDHREFRTRSNNLLTIGRQRRIIRQRAASLERELDDALRRQAEVLRRGEATLRRLLDSIPALILTTNASGRCLMVNGYRNLLASGPDSQAGTVEGMFGADYRRRHAPLDRRVLETGQTLPAFEEALPDSFGRMRFFMTTKTPLFSEGGRIDAVVTVSVDVSDRKGSEDRMLLQTGLDPVCGLPNRLIALDRLSQAMVRAREGGGGVAVLFVDLDGLKKVYEQVGPAIGDRVVVAAASRIAGCVDPSDTVARLSGDAFLVLLPLRDDHPGPAVEGIITALRAPFPVDDGSFTLKVAVGIAEFPKDGSSPEELVSQAHAAMRRAKAAGPAGACVFTAEMTGDPYGRAELEALLRRALERGEFRVLYQPIADVRDGRITGMEALLRWHSRELGVLAPERFLPVAEETGLSLAIGRWVLEEACRQSVRWGREAGRLIGVTVNLSSRQVLDPGFPALVEGILTSSGLAPAALELEMPERLLLGDSGHVLDVLDRLHRLGVRLAIDDFGTGYASIMCLRRFPFDRLKIDGSFVSAATESIDGGALVATMLGVARGLDLQTVCEGVETSAQLDFLRVHGCQSYQGYLLGQPMEAEDCLPLITACCPNGTSPAEA